MIDFEKKKRLAKLNGTLDKLYAERIREYLRERYSIDDELAIQRQRNEKPEDFEAYYTFVEECKVQAKKDVFDD